MNNMKVLQIPTGGLLSDGICNCIMSYISNMDLSDMQVDLLAVNQASPADIHNAERHGLHVYSIPCRKSRPILYFQKLICLIKKEKYDIIHVHGSSGILAIELLAAKFAGCRVRIAHSHNTKCDNVKADKLLRPIFSKLYTQAFACGVAAGDWLFQDKKYIVLPNGRDLDLFAFSMRSREKIRSEWRVSEKTVVIGHVGRFNQQKNHEFLIDVFYEFKKKNADSKLILIGTGEYINKVQKKVSEYGLQNDVVFSGVVANVPDLLSAMDVMVLPSLYEGLPLVVIEWQAAGLPCIISDTVTDECIVEDNVRQLSLSQSPVVWAENIRPASPDERARNSEKIKRDMSLAGYDIKEQAQRLKNYYQKFICEGKQ